MELKVRDADLIVPVRQIEPELSVRDAASKGIERTPVLPVRAHLVNQLVRPDLNVHVDERGVVRQIEGKPLLSLPLSVDDLGAREVFVVYLEREVVARIGGCNNPLHGFSAPPRDTATGRSSNRERDPADRPWLVVQREAAALPGKPVVVGLYPALLTLEQLHAGDDVVQVERPRLSGDNDGDRLGARYAGRTLGGVVLRPSLEPEVLLWPGELLHLLVAAHDRDLRRGVGQNIQKALRWPQRHIREADGLPCDELARPPLGFVPRQGELHRAPARVAAVV